MPVHSARPFIVRGGEIRLELDRIVVDRGEVPIYVAEIAVARDRKLWEDSAPPGGRIFTARGPSLSEVEQAGGFDPQRLLDLLAGGDFARVWRRALPDVDPSDVTEGNAARFPLRGGPATDGTGVEAGFVPRYLAKLAFVLFQAHALAKGVGGRVPRFDEIERAGGFKPHEFLDLLCGGNGSGGALTAMNARAVVTARGLVRGMKIG